MNKPPKNFDDYLRGFPEHAQQRLRAMRDTIRKAAPSANETISYSMPAFAVEGKILVWYGAFARHLGFYPGADGVAAFEKELKPYEHAKGSIRFPFDEPFHAALVTRIVKYRLRNLER